MNLSSFLASVLEQSAPILLAALAAMITLRANILNVAVEGMMLVAAFVAIAVGNATGSAALAFFAAVIASIAMSQLLALMTLRFSADFIVAGLSINLLAAGGSLFALEWFYRSPGGLRPITFPDIWHVPAGSLSFLCSTTSKGCSLESHSGSLRANRATGNQSSSFRQRLLRRPGFLSWASIQVLLAAL